MLSLSSPHLTSLVFHLTPPPSSESSQAKKAISSSRYLLKSVAAVTLGRRAVLVVLIFSPPLPPHCHHHHQQLHSLQPVGNGISWLPSKGVQQQQQRSSFSRLRRPLAPVVCVCVCRLGHHSTPLSFAFTLSLSHRDPMTTIASRAVRRPP